MVRAPRSIAAAAQMNHDDSWLGGTDVLGMASIVSVAARVVSVDTGVAHLAARARELLEDGVSALLVPPGDPAALAEAITRLASDPDLAQGLSARGLDTYQRTASLDVLGRRWRELVEEAVG